MYLAKVYKVMIGAPSDIQEEIQMAKNVIQKWNSINSEFRRRVLLPLHWSDNAYPETGIHPQKSINRMVVEKSDLLICIFCSRLGSPTDTHNSGSIEEIDEHIKAGKDVMVFFKKNAPIPRSSNDLEQMKHLLEYKETVRDKLLWWEYDDESCFESILKDKLELYINDNWINSDDERGAVAEEGTTLKLTKTEISILCGSSGYVDVEGVDADRCVFKIKDRNVAYAHEHNSRVKIEGRKVGETTLTVSYRNLKTECCISITPMYMFCGNPILEFGKDMDFVIGRCGNLTYDKESDNCIRCRETSSRYIVNHYYVFEESKLYFVFSKIELLNPKGSNTNLFSEALHCMNERYESINSDTRITWYQYKDEFYIVSINPGHDSNKWFFCYAPTKEIMDKKLAGLNL